MFEDGSRLEIPALTLDDAWAAAKELGAVSVRAVQQ